MRRSKRKAIQKTTTATTSAAAVPAVTISEFPNHIICDILTRLPLNSIFACKLVCKAWRDLTLEPCFAKLHLSRSPLSLISYHNGNNTTNSTSYFEILQLYDPLAFRRPDATVKFKTQFYFPRMQVVASCNGLILLSNLSSDDDDHVIIVCNPLRAQHFILPRPPELALPTHKQAHRTALKSGLLGFGHSPSTNQYKVVRFTNSCMPARLYCDVFTIGIDDEWRSMGDTGQPPALVVSQVVFLDGVLHWIGADNALFICCFHIETEHFRSFPLPSHIGTDLIYLMVVDNRLCFHKGRSFGEWRFWAMKDFGDFGSWTVEWVIEEPIIYKFEGCVRPLEMLKDGSLLMAFQDFSSRERVTKTTIASYNPRTRVLKMNNYHVILPSGASVSDIPRFFSPMDALK